MTELSKVQCTITRLSPDDRAAWQDLARRYHTFYDEVVAPASYDATWTRLMRDDELHGFGAYVDGQLIGISHCLFHAHVWDRDVCYLQDLFVDERHRGRGIGRSLIEHIARAAADRNALRVYWMTKADNEAARGLYDKIAAHHGFLRYDLPL
jgi:ribosomal protein S18 acetylase RimI-like enzyme